MTRHPYRRHGRAAAAAALGLALAAALAACSAGSPSASESGFNAQRGAVTPQAPAPGGDLAGPPATDGSGGTAGKPQVTLPPTLPQAAVQRSIIYNGSMTVRVTDVNGAADRAGALANGAGGYVGGDARQTVSAHNEATVVLRVPAGHFDATMAALAALGTPVDRQVTTQDVTSQVVDIGSRIKTQQASVDRIRALLAKATSIGDVESIESELTQRESDLESMEAQLAALADLSALSTITLTLIEPDAPPVVAKKPAAAKGFVAGLKKGWKSFQSFLSTVLTWIGTVLPYAVTIAVLLWLILWVARRRRARRAPVTGQLAMAGPPLPGYGTSATRPAPTAPPAPPAPEQGTDQDAG